MEKFPGTDGQSKFAIQDNMRIVWDMPIEMDDGIVLRADIYLPIPEGRYPVIMTYGPYGKGLQFQAGYPSAWQNMVAAHPEVVRGTTCKYTAWETVDPEKWTCDGYVVVRVDSRGAGRSPGKIDHWSPRESKDYHDCINWAGTQPWSNGKVGLNGISYYAANQWRVAATQPKHLAAICVWEGFGDLYRDAARNGGMAMGLFAQWPEKQVLSVQHGLGERGPRNPITGDLVCGPETLSDEELAANRENIWEDFLSRPLDCEWYRVRSPDWSKIVVPVLSAANWGGQALHPRGNFEGFERSASSQKWLEVHGLEHWTHFYTDYGVALQKRFFGHFLKGEDTGWREQPPVSLQIRHPGEVFVQRAEQEWPIKRTQWTKMYLDLQNNKLTDKPPLAEASATYNATSEGLKFWTEPFKEEIEITGPLSAKLYISSSTDDADIFLVLSLYDPEGKEVVWSGTIDPHTPMAQGWLRASQRKLDPVLSKPWQPYHTHDECQPLTPGSIYELDIEIWPTCAVAPPGYRFCFNVRSRDYEWDGPPVTLSNLKYPMRGCGPFFHNDPIDRPEKVAQNDVTIHMAPGMENYVLLPVIPKL